MKHNHTTTFVISAQDPSVTWGKGDSLLEAIRAIKTTGARKSDMCYLSIVFDGENAHNDEDGILRYGGHEFPEAWCVNVGVIGTLGALMKGNKYPI